MLDWLTWPADLLLMLAPLLRVGLLAKMLLISSSFR